MTEHQIRGFRYRGLGIPEHMIGGTLRYFNDHIEPGDFLCAVLINDFMEACGRADEKNLAATSRVGGVALQRGSPRQLREPREGPGVAGGQGRMTQSTKYLVHIPMRLQRESDVGRVCVTVPLCRCATSPDTTYGTDPDEKFMCPDCRALAQKLGVA